MAAPALLVPKTRTLELPGELLTLRAAFQPETFQVLEGGNPVVKLIASAGAAVRRVGWFDGGLEEFDELLSFEQGAHRDERLNSNRVNLLLDHDRFNVRQVFGVLSDPVWDRTARTLTVTARLSRRQDLAGLVQDVRDGILVNTSIGYRTYQVKDVTKKGDARRQIQAIDWETREVSMVSVPADGGSHVRTDLERSSKETARTTVVVLARSEEEPMEPDTNPAATSPSPAAPADAGRAAQPAAGAPAPAAPAPAPAAPTPTVSDADRAADAEVARQRTIRARLSAAQLQADDEFARSLLDDRRVTPDGASSRILERMASRGAAGPELDGHVRLGAEEGEALARAVADAILYRTNQTHFIDGIGTGGPQGIDRTKLAARLQGNPFLHRSLLEVGEEFVGRTAGLRRLSSMPKMDRAGVILRPRMSDDQRAGSVGLGHSTSDFPGILANVVNKVLRGTFDLTPETYSQWTNPGTLADYKAASRVQLGHAPRLLPVREGAEYTYGTMGEQNEPIVLGKFGRIVSITREMMINDDLDAFSRIPRQYGGSTRQLIADLVYAHLTGNTVMADGLAIFHATHKNLVTGVGNSLAAAGVASLSNLRTKAALQTSIDSGLAGGDTPFFLSVQIQHLRVPAELQTAAEQLTTLIQAQTVGGVNPFQGEFRTVMAEPRLSASSALAYYGMQDPSMGDTIEVAFLQGESGPQVETRIGFERDGMDVKVRMDVATAPTDFRGLYKNEGTV